MEKYKVVEHFVSINGEGNCAGQASYFVRFHGCGLSCTYCDTRWANEADTEITEMTAEEIYSTIKLSGITNITLTGGEPLMQPGIGRLIEILLANEDFRVEIETNGSIDLSPFIPQNGRRPVFTMDYKLPSSNMEIMMLVSNFKHLAAEDTVKFVAGDESDLIRAKNVIDAYSLTDICHVHLSPVFGEMEPVEIIEFMIDNCMNGINLQLQLHKVIWDPKKRGV
ncbi:MAG: putative 7-carboxy-7-deazaguanine synthase QueE [Firmicutes bacterium]|nr:putative 7-carboxy-7-deazaguanine synthase QueE [Bacillota bacterium]